MQSINLAFLSKPTFRVLSNPDSLISKLHISKYKKKNV